MLPTMLRNYRLTFATALAAVPLAIFVACSDDEDPDPGGNINTPNNNSGNNNAGNNNSGNNNMDTEPPVSTQTSALGTVYADSTGLTLYTFNADTVGVSNCNDACATAWPPLVAADDGEASGDFSIITRMDGSRQWALHGWPLYRWMNDTAAGDVDGEEVNSIWYVAEVAPVSKWSAEVTTAGSTNTVTVLTDIERMTLYVFTVDRTTPGGSACNGACADAWPPLLAAETATTVGDYAFVTRDDGARQWAYRGLPLYRYVNDDAPGDTAGEGVNDVWFVAQPLPVSKFNTTAEGVVITDAEWLTLYILDNEITTGLVCTGACLTAWPPLLANDGEVDRGDYTVFTNDDGQRQWAYKDRPLYRWMGDTSPDDTLGEGLNHPSGGVWTVARP